MPSDTPPHRVLFVCMGNICRSPSAEIIFRHLVCESGHSECFEIDSAGTIGYHAGSPPDPRMSESLQSAGFTISGKARQIRAKDLETFDLIVTMDEANYDDVIALDPGGTNHGKVRPFVEFCSHHDDLRVPDPYYGGKRGFDHVVALLKDGCSGILDSFHSP